MCERERERGSGKDVEVRFLGKHNARKHARSGRKSQQTDWNSGSVLNNL